MISDSRLHQTVTLSDGRTLGYAEYGDPDGAPLFFFHGTPGNRLMAAPGWDDASLGLRVIAPDRPGLGLSTYLPGRILRDWPDDVAELADVLGIDRFRVAGVSGGGPHSLACAAELGDRVICAGVIAGAAPMDSPEAIKAMHPGNRMTFTLARKAPFVLRGLMALMSRLEQRGGARVEKALERSMPAADVEILRDADIKASFLEWSKESHRQGSRAVTDEAIFFVQPWGFAIEDIEVPVLLWHGSEDRNAPLQMAKEMERRIPNCTATYYEGEGHLFFIRRWPEIARALAACG